MRRLALGVAALVVAALAGCGLGEDEGAGQATTQAAPATGRKAALSIRPVVSGLESPVNVTAPRSEPGRLYVVEQAGRILVVENGRVREEPFLDIRSIVRSGGEQGLLAVAVHPNYE